LSELIAHCTPRCLRNKSEIALVEPQNTCAVIGEFHSRAIQSVAPRNPIQDLFRQVTLHQEVGRGNKSGIVLPTAVELVAAC
jgi:hypothetical protein